MLSNGRWCLSPIQTQGIRLNFESLWVYQLAIVIAAVFLYMLDPKTITTEDTCQGMMPTLSRKRLPTIHATDGDAWEVRQEQRLGRRLGRQVLLEAMLLY